MNKLKIDEEINLDLDTELEDKNLFTLVSLALLVLWLISMFVVYT